MKYCDSCGCKLNSEQKFCSNCGKTLKTNDNIKANNLGIRIIFNILKILLYITSFVMFFFIIVILVSKSNGECYEHYCENNLIMFISGFIASLVLAIICSLLSSKFKKKK